MIKHNPSEERKAVDQVNALLQRPVKPKKDFWHRLLEFLHLAKEAEEFAFDKKKAAESFKKDIDKIELERERQHRQIMSERRRLEKLARAKASKERQAMVKSWFGASHRQPEKLEGLDWDLQVSAERLRASGVTPPTLADDKSNLSLESNPELRSAIAQSRVSVKLINPTVMPVSTTVPAVTPSIPAAPALTKASAPTPVSAPAPIAAAMPVLPAAPSLTPTKTPEPAPVAKPSVRPLFHFPRRPEPIAPEHKPEIAAPIAASKAEAITPAVPTPPAVPAKPALPQEMIAPAVKPIEKKADEPLAQPVVVASVIRLMPQVSPSPLVARPAEAVPPQPVFKTGVRPSTTISVDTEPQAEKPDVKIREENIVSSEAQELPAIIIEQRSEAFKAPSAQAPIAQSVKPEVPGKPLPVVARPEKPIKHSSFFESKVHAAKKFAEEYKKESLLLVKDQVENRYWQALNMVRANLVREQRSLFYNWRSKILDLIFIGLLSALVVLVSYGALFLWEADKKKNNQYLFDNVAAIEKQITVEEVRMAEVEQFNNRLLYVAYLLDNHIYWSNFFKMLEYRTTPDAYFESFSGDLKGTFSIPGVAAKDRALFLESKVLQNFGDTRVKKAEPANMKPFVQVVALSPNPSNPPAEQQPSGLVQAPVDDRIRFDMKLEINPKMLLYKCYVGPGETINNLPIKATDGPMVNPVKQPDGTIIEGDQATIDSETLVKKYCPYF